MRIVFLLTLLLFSACSTKTPPNLWQYQSHYAYKNFERYYLQNQLDLAVIELDRARESASQSADFTTLASIELSVCALQVSLLKPFTCKKFKQLQPLVHSKALDAYAHFLANSLSTDEINYLPKQYHAFAYAKEKQEIATMQKEIQTMTSPLSKMISASLIRNSLSPENIDNIITSASHYGYKQSIIVWLRFQLSHTNKEDRRSEIEKKLHLLQKVY